MKAPGSYLHRLSACAFGLSVAGWENAAGERGLEPRYEVIARPGAPRIAVQENPLDVDVPPPPRPRPTAPRPDAMKPTEPLPNLKVRTPADEDLPAWVPISHRLTVVESCDLAENLGLAPPGTARRGGCPSVAELMAKGPGVPPGSPAILVDP